MKLPTKSEIDRTKSLEAKETIDRGLKLAKRVDELRVAKQKEEKDLDAFRTQTVKIVQGEIDAKIIERDALASQNAKLAEERLRLQAPIDLTEEWEKVSKDKLEIEQWKRDLFERESSVITRELVLAELPEREATVKEKELKAEKYLADTNKSYDTVEQIRLEMESKRKISDSDIEKRYETLSEMEKGLAERENALVKTKDQLAFQERELLARGTGLIARESTVEAKTNELFEREEKVKEAETLAKRYTLEAKHNYDDSEVFKLKAETAKKETEMDIEEKYRVLATKQKEQAVKERDLNLERQSIEREKAKIADDRIHIQSQQETLRTAWEQIKRLQTKYK